MIRRRGADQIADISDRAVALKMAEFEAGWRCFPVGGPVYEMAPIAQDVPRPTAARGNLKDGRPAEWERIARIPAVVEGSDIYHWFEITGRQTFEAMAALHSQHRDAEFVIIRLIDGTKQINGKVTPVFEVVDA